MSSCPYPDISHLDDFFTGCLMGDGWIDHSGSNPSFGVGSKEKEYVNYVDGMLGNVSTNIRVRDLDDGGGYGNGTFYVLTTRRHPHLDKFAGWYDSGEKVWPDSVDLTPTTLKHWFVGDGTFDNTNTAFRVSIACYNERKNVDKISSYFRDVSLPEPNYYHESENAFKVVWSADATRELFEYMGDPLPGFEYKWPDGY
ncbi:hypothetical protein [Natrinema sp. DC36]|uniref:hypothetical protein n=1 Tax=Natrinema sp. DC36 TaxID=2878680 RepID=UPI002102C427|nr:hypothetical protein [Natrinema sp. DC36]